MDKKTSMQALFAAMKTPPGGAEPAPVEPMVDHLADDMGEELCCPKCGHRGPDAEFKEDKPEYDDAGDDE